MFSWYEKSKICLAYLRDFDDDVDPENSFGASEWFTRSWMLQELLVPHQSRLFRQQLETNRK